MMTIYLYSFRAVFSGNRFLIILLSFLFWDYVKRLDIAYLNYILVSYCWWLFIENIFDIIDFIWDLLFFVLTLILSPLDLVFWITIPKRDFEVWVLDEYVCYDYRVYILPILGDVSRRGGGRCAYSFQIVC